ncbi:MAG: hypothetical protein IJX51_00895 [Clostridia bacterium]|nr:hypothetical protein [Clostridia bacterium]
MNKIEIRNLFLSSGYEAKAFFIDGRPLYEYINEWLAKDKQLLQSITPNDDLAICWTNDYDFEGDSKFMRYILNQSNAITPILSCPEDFDFSCIVIVADVIKKDDKVIWRRIGTVNHSNESFEQEKRSGILYVDSYSKEDWTLYGDNIASTDVDSPEWRKWIGDNWTEELYRRRINYTFPYYQNEQNIDWFSACDFEFDKNEYDALIASCYTD